MPADGLVSFDSGVLGGYTDNLNNASSDEDKTGSEFLDAWFSASLADERILDPAQIYLTGTYERINYTDYSDLAVNNLILETGFSYPFSEVTVFSIETFSGSSNYNDSDRNATFHGFSIVLQQTFSNLDTSLGYTYTDNDAKESVFSYTSKELRLSGEIEMWNSIFCSVSYAVTSSESVRYQTILVPIPSGGKMGKPSVTFAPREIAYRTETSGNVFSLNLEKKVAGRISLLIDYSHSYVKSDTGNYRINAISGGIGYRF